MFKNTAGAGKEVNQARLCLKKTNHPSLPSPRMRDTLNYGWVSWFSFKFVLIPHTKINFSNQGTHSNCPSEIKIDNSSKRVLLSEYLKEKGQKCLGDDSRIENFYGTTLSPGDLPFLFKVLSINQALSIQAHPNKSLARELHARDPKNYPDANHKPEMLIAISDLFEGLCGFRLGSEIACHFELYPELADLCGRSNSDRFVQLEKSSDRLGLEESLRKCFESLMMASDERVKTNLGLLKSRILQTGKLYHLNDLSLYIYNSACTKL